MKRLFLLLLAALMLLSACGNPTDDSDFSTPSNSDDSSIPPESEWDYRTLVSKGKPYTASVPANENYTDKYGQQLTDGEKTAPVGAHYSDPRMVGFTSNVSFVIDLGEDAKNIREIVARTVCMYQDGVGVASSAKFAGSADGQSFTNLGTVLFADTGDLTVSEAKLVLEEPVDYRFIRVNITRGSGYAFFFTDEIEVYANVPPKAVEDSSKTAYENENIDRNAWKSLSTGVSVDPVDTKVLSVYKDYSFENCKLDERAVDVTEEEIQSGAKKKLTDGDRVNRYFSEKVWVGITPESAEADPAIKLSLGEAEDNIYAMKVYAQGAGNNVDLPAYIDVYAAVSSKYTFIGRMYGPAEGDNFAFTLLLPEYIKAKNFRFVFPNEAKNYWVEEIEIIAGYNEEVSDLFYPPLNFPEVTETLLWDETESDYETYQNLLLGNIQQVNPLFYADIDTRGDESPADFSKLTDGKLSKNLNCYGGDYFFSRGNAGIEFIFDLGKLSSISSVNVSYLEQESWAICRPKFAAILLSEDGENWYKVGDYIRGDVQMNKNATAMNLPFEFDRTYAARFIRVRLEGSFTFVDEIEAFGTKKVGEDAVRLADSGMISSPYYLNESKQQFATTENTPIKASHIPILYSNKTLPENLLPLVAYLDEEGNIKDTLMDGFLYCTSGILPSGKLPHLENYKQDWDYLFDTYFNGQAGLDVLETTVQQVKDTLNKPDYKVQVYLTILITADTVTDFGDIDGDGVGENFTTTEGRKKVYDWFIKKCKAEFEARGYNNLELGGFYWMNEEVNWEKDDSHIIAEAAEVIHANDSYFLWIPYYAANRYYTGYELGFDSISMQPNVVFTTDAPYWRFDASINFTKLRKMAIEIEHSYQAFGDPDFARSFLLYLLNGVRSGYDKAINIYYDDIDNFSVMGYSDEALCRLQYDYIYHYTKGDLDITPDTKETYKLNGATDTVISGELNANNAIAKFTLLTPPQHGYVAMCEDGGFRYFPEKGYEGTDTFTYTYNCLLGESEPCTVEITIE